jgi:hypothetical protein
VSWVLGGVTVLVVAGLAALLVLSAVRRTMARQEAGLPPLPECPPPGPPLLSEPARYLGTTYAPSSIRRFNGFGPARPAPGRPGAERRRAAGRA